MKNKKITILALASLTGAMLSGCGQKGASEYQVTASTGEGYLVSFASTAKAGADYTFTVAINEGYQKGSAYTVKVNDNAYVETAGVYTVTNVQSDLAITVAGVEKMSYAITYENGTGYTLAGPSSVLYNENLSGVTATFDAHHKAGTSFAVNANGKAMSKGSDGSYSYTGIKAATKVTASGVEIKGYSVSHTEGEGILFSGDDLVSDGASYTFNVALKTGYEGTLVVAASMGGATVTPTENGNGSYTIASVTGDLIISVTGAALQKFAITKPSGTGYTFTGDDSVTYGSDYTFTLTLTDGYEKGTDFAVTATMGAESAQVIAAENGYQIKNVTAALAIVVAGVNKKSYAVTKPSVEGIDFVGEDRALYGEDYLFTVAPKSGYQKTASWAVMVNGAAAVATSVENQYKVANVTGSLFITASGVEEITFNVTFAGDIAGALTNTSDTYRYSATSYNFALAFASDYTQSADSSTLEVSYSIGGGSAQILTKGSDGSYSITNPHADIAVSVKGIAINHYSAIFMVAGVEVSRVSIAAHDTVSAEQIAAAVTAGASKLSTNQKIVGWDKDFTALSADTTYNARVADGISDAAALMAITGSSANFYLMNDIDITSVLGSSYIKNFTGLLDGQGHKIYATKELRESETGAIFGEKLSGTVRHLSVELYTNTALGYWSNSPFAYKIETGAVIEDVAIKTSYAATAAGAGVVCTYLNGGTLKDVTINLTLPSYDATADKVGGVCYRLSEGAVMKNVKVLLPDGAPTTLSSYIALDGTFTPDLTGYSVARDDSVRLLDDPLYESEGTLSTSTLNGQPIYVTSVTDQGNLFNRSFDLRLFDEVRFAVCSSIDVSFTGDGTIYGSAKEWSYLDITRASDNTFSILCNRNGNACAVKSGLSETVLSRLLGFYEWHGKSITDFQTTPLYVVKSRGQQIASSAFASTTAVNASAMTITAAMGTNNAETRGLDAFNTVDISGYSTVTFSCFFDDQTDHVDHSVSFVAADSLGGTALIYEQSWALFTLTKTSGTGTSSVWTLTINWLNLDNTSYTTNTRAGLTGGTLNSLLTMNTNRCIVAQSTPVYGA